MARYARGSLHVEAKERRLLEVETSFLDALLARTLYWALLFLRYRRLYGVVGRILGMNPVVVP